MKTGKISENILKRSVLGRIKDHTTDKQPSGESVCFVQKGAGVGEDCAFLAWEDPISADEGVRASVLTAASTQTISLPMKRGTYFAVMAAANNLAASGAVPEAVTLALTFPEETEESLLREEMDYAEECCGELGIRIVGGHTEVSGAVRWPVITATVLGALAKSPLLTEKDAGDPAALDVVMSKWIGIEGTAIILQERQEELLKRFSTRFLSMARKQERYLSVAREAAIALKSNVYAMHDVRSGGIFGALWELSQKLGVGLSIDLKKIPVRQETIEVCELFGLNPYELLSGGSLLMAAEDGQGLVRALTEAGIPAELIGRTNKSSDRIVTNGEETRYLGPAGPDEIYKLRKDTVSI